MQTVLSPPTTLNTAAPAPRDARAWQRWQQIGLALADPDIELDLETFAPLLATFQFLKARGYAFDATLTALMNVLKRQGFHNDGESDWDADPLRNPNERPVRLTPWA